MKKSHKILKNTSRCVLMVSKTFKYSFVQYSSRAYEVQLKKKKESKLAGWTSNTPQKILNALIFEMFWHH
jgi:hypothetical protein